MLAVLDDHSGFWNGLTYVGFNKDGQFTVLGLEENLMPGFMMDFSDDETNVTIQVTEESGGDSAESFSQGDAN